jgi:hypothetical protein
VLNKYLWNKYILINGITPGACQLKSGIEEGKE